MDIFKKNLVTLGYTDDEITIYLAALELGRATPLVLARTTGIPRTTVYLLLDTLVRKQLLEVEGIETKRVYKPVAPDEIIRIAQKKKNDMQEAVLSLRHELPQLQALYSTHSGSPKIRCYTNPSEMQQVFEGLEKSTRLYIHRCTNDDQSEWENLLQSAIERWEKAMIPIKEILCGVPKNEDPYSSEFRSARHEIKIMKQLYSNRISLFISDDSILFINTSVEKFFALLLSDQALAQFEHYRFQTIWDEIVEN